MNNSDMPASPLYFKSADEQLKIEAFGLTKREAFAMAAMQGWLSRCSNVPHTHELKPEIMAEVSVSMADALLKELDKE
jgi:hypothetical protein